jgi:AraC-like DNA-binding protein
VTGVVYRERPAGVEGVVLWRREARTGDVTRILPDACLDLIWVGSALVVAGPDLRARLHEESAPTAFVALRFSAGIGPALLGVPAADLRDTSPRLDELWPAAAARELAERVAADPVAALEGWLLSAVADHEPDPLGARILALASAGASVTATADAVGLGVRRLHRRSLALFGYGPQHLVRVKRLERALARARRGTPLARVAAEAGYADQAHFARDVRDLAGTTASELLGQDGSDANRSTGVPSGSRTTA